MTEDATPSNTPDNPSDADAPDASLPLSPVLLSTAHQTLLIRDSGLTAAVVASRGYRTFDEPKDLEQLGFSKPQSRTAPVLGIPLWDVHGNHVDWQIRPDTPRQSADGKVFKYENRKGGRLILDVHPSVQPLLADPKVPLWITEGVRKGDALATLGACTIALTGGVWGFKGRNQHDGLVILSDWGYIPLNDRLVYVAYDADLSTNRKVDAAFKALYKFLRSRSAIPCLMKWPATYHNTKMGVDDFLAQGHTLDDLLSMIPKPGPLPARPPQPSNGIANGDPNTVSLPYSEYTNALALVREHGENLRYCHPWGKWLIWTGTRWQQDVSGAVMRMAKQTIKHMAMRLDQLDDDEAEKLLKHVKTSLATSKLKSMIESSQSEDGIHVQPEDLDKDQWLLNCANGTVDLRTGILKTPHDREDLITRCINTPYDPTADCSEWKAFLWKIMDQKQDVIDFLQRIIGLSLTGDVREQYLFVLWGSGANGKSTLLNTILKLLGPYAMKATAELLMTTRNDRHPTERADLFGKRCVATIETRESGRLNETFVKEATGGDPIRARRMREDFWEFEPTHKIFLATNHKPQIVGTDHAIWRRIRLVPFTVTIPDDQQDKQLVTKLNAELPGILAWAVRGCLDWQKNGICETDEITNATNSYKNEMDDIAKFISEMCITNVPSAQVKSNLLYSSYLDWGGDREMSQKSFSMRMVEHGYGRERRKTGMFWQKIGLSGLSGERRKEDQEY